MTKTQYAKVISTLSAMLFSDMCSLSSERNFPQHDADASDDRIKFLEMRIASLRRIRQEIETLFSESR